MGVLRQVVRRVNFSDFFGVSTPFGVQQVRTPASKLSTQSQVPWAARSRTLNAWLASSLASATVARIIFQRRSRIGTWRSLKNCGSGIISTVRHVSPLIVQGRCVYARKKKKTDGLVKGSPACHRAVLETVEALRKAGHECIQIDPPDSAWRYRFYLVANPTFGSSYRVAPTFHCTHFRRRVREANRAPWP